MMTSKGDNIKECKIKDYSVKGDDIKETFAPFKAGLYVHVPFCSAKCPYCDFVSFKADFDVQKAYVAALKREIESISQSGLAKDYVFDTVFVGGGTPSALYPGGLSDIFDHISKFFNLNLIEFTVEANPESASSQFLSECRSLGANRISFGLQSTSDEVLRNLRRHTYADFLRAHELAVKHGFSNINADIMLGLPNQDISDINNSVKNLAELKLKHISVYALTVEKGTPMHDSGYSPDDDGLALFYQTAAQELIRNGYKRYEVSNFCLDGYECRHNQKYWSLEPYVGLGLNASSYYHTGTRVVNTAQLKDYLKGDFAGFKEDVTDKFAYEYIMLSMRTDNGADLSLLKNLGVDLLKNPKVKTFLDKKILFLNKNRLVLNEDYYYLMNSVIVELV